MFFSEIDHELKLALVHKSFAPRYAELARDNFIYLQQWLSWPPHCKSKYDFEEFIQHSLLDYAKGKSMVCAIFYHDQLVGNIGFNTINHQLEKVEIGYWLAEPYQGNGIITRACRALIKMAFEQWNMQKIQISAATENAASRAVCQRLGMTLEGIITRNENLGGRVVDHAIYALHQPDIT
ncbi:GNAT family N-acetyltransferase [Vibrio sp. MA40-2]|uniref:GNAT family N-acetyltransferase n=1 Tax=Vibrio sp. MA40-2 TaxID=3391828 RepID=UPI0039A49AD1